MRRVPGYFLWLGHVGDVRDLSGLLALKIAAVVDLALEEPPAKITRELIYCRFPLIDGGGNPRWLLRASIETVASLLSDRVPTLLYCGACMSRTPSVAGAAIALVRGCSAVEGLALVVQSGHCDVSPVLWSDIVEATRSCDTM